MNRIILTNFKKYNISISYILITDQNNIYKIPRAELNISSINNYTLNPAKFK